jgi:hypothetical protein
MRVKQVRDIEGFFKAFQKCEGRVELITDENDVLNLSSTLTQFVCITKIFNNPEIKEYDIVCQHAEDYQLIKKFLCHQNK